MVTVGLKHSVGIGCRAVSAGMRTSLLTNGQPTADHYYRLPCQPIRSHARSFHSTNLLQLRAFNPPCFNMKLHENMLAEGFKPPYAWPWETKPYTWFNFMGESDPTVWKFHENTKVIIVEGNVGVGKTRFCEEVARMFNLKFVRDPTPEMLAPLESGWDESKYSYLLPDSAKTSSVQEFYRDPENQGRSGMFQWDMLRARAYTWMRELNHVLNTGQGLIFERSMYSDFVFIEAMAQAGYVSRAARQFYYEVQQSIVPDSTILKPHLVIYLDATVDTCLDRIKQRGRPMEIESKVLNPTYLKRIEKEYKTLFLNSMRRHCLIKVYDWNEFPDFDLVGEDIEKISFEAYMGTYGSVLESWIYYDQDFEWDQHRVAQGKWEDYTNERLKIMNVIAPELWIHEDDSKIYNDLRREVTARNQGDYIREYDVVARFKQMFKWRKGDTFAVNPKYETYD